MHPVFRRLGLAMLIASQARLAQAQAKPAAATTFPLNSVNGLEPVNATVEAVEYRGRKAVRLVPLPGYETQNESMEAILTSTDFHDGVIELDVSGTPRPGAPADARGFVGVAFRVDPHAAHYEAMYLRPTNGRADDQLRRNHSTQYISYPDYPWQRLRQETPGQYESYVDLEPGAWTHMRIEVSGTTARLFVNRATQPALIVRDLKLGEGHGAIALWAWVETDPYFSNLSVVR